MPALYVTHPEVVIEPQVPMPRWGLSAEGRWRAERFAARGIIAAGTRILSSTERKAVETAEILAAAAGSTVEMRAELGENDRSATGYLPPVAFEAQVKLLFSRPHESASGWETASAAQARIVAAVNTVLAAHDPSRPIIFVGHGCVGTLLKCHLGGRAIALSEDQRVMAWPGGGNVFAFDVERRRLLTDWAAFESFVPLGA